VPVTVKAAEVPALAVTVIVAVRVPEALGLKLTCPVVQPLAG